MAAAGMEVPALDNRPVTIGLNWLWEAFMDLTTCRPIGMGVGPIPWTAIQTYAESERLDPEETWTLHQVIRHMDQVYLEHTHRKDSGRPVHKAQ